MSNNNSIATIRGNVVYVYAAQRLSRNYQTCGVRSFRLLLFCKVMDIGESNIYGQLNVSAPYSRLLYIIKHPTFPKIYMVLE